MKQLISTIILTLILAVSCSEDEIYSTFSIGMEDSFKQGVINQSMDQSLVFKISKINDSRCPSDVTCVWEGKADVTLKIEEPQTGTLVLSTYDNLVDTFGNYVFHLIDVSPYPISTQEIKLEDYDVSLKIENLQD